MKNDNLNKEALAALQQSDLRLNRQDYKFNAIISAITMAVSLAIGAAGVHVRNENNQLKAKNADRIEELEGIIGRPCNTGYRAPHAEKSDFRNKLNIISIYEYPLRAKILGQGVLGEKLDNDDLDKNPFFCQIVRSHFDEKIAFHQDQALLIEYISLKHSEQILINPLLASLIAEVLIISIYLNRRRKNRQSDWSFLKQEFQKFLSRHSHTRVELEKEMLELKDLKKTINQLIKHEEQIVADIKGKLEPSSTYRVPAPIAEELIAQRVRLAVDQGNIDEAIAIYRGEASMEDLCDASSDKENSADSQ